MHEVYTYHYKFVSYSISTYACTKHLWEFVESMMVEGLETFYRYI